MNRHVRDSLKQLLATEGKAICALPQLIAGRLRELHPADDDTIRLLMLAVEAGAVEKLMQPSALAGGLAPLIDSVAARGPNEEHARWALEAWAVALAAATTPVRPPDSADWAGWNAAGETALGNTARWRHAPYYLTLTGVAGLLGGLLPGLLFALRWHKPHVGRRETSLLSGDMQLFSLAVLGGLGGALGAAASWFVRDCVYQGNDLRRTTRAIAVALSSFFGAALGAVIGVSFFGLVGVAFWAALFSGLPTILGLGARRLPVAAYRETAEWVPPGSRS